MAVANVADGDDDDDELKRPVEPRSGSITVDAFEVELKQLPAESLPAEPDEDDVGMVGSVEPL